MEYILILTVIAHHAVTIETVEFEDQRACETAATQWLESIGDLNNGKEAKALCVLQ